jgi:hypothetical protein
MQNVNIVSTLTTGLLLLTDRPLVVEGASHVQYRNCRTVTNIWWGLTSRQTDRPTVGRNATLTLIWACCSSLTTPWYQSICIRRCVIGDLPYAGSPVMCYLYLLDTRKALKLCCLQRGRRTDHVSGVHGSSKVKCIGYEDHTAVTTRITYYLLTCDVVHSGKCSPKCRRKVLTSSSVLKDKLRKQSAGIRQTDEWGSRNGDSDDYGCGSFFAWPTLRPWRLWQYVPSKRR